MTPLCPMCGEPEMLEIADIWSGHEFMLEACCAGRHEQVVTDMADDPVWAVDLFRQLGAEELTGLRERHHLELTLAEDARARSWNREVERHCAVAGRIKRLLADLGEETT